MRNLSAAKTLFSATILLSGGAAAAEPIAIVNPGFEADFVSDGCFAVFTPP